MLFHVDMIYLANRPNAFYVKTKKVCRYFASFSSEQELFSHGMYVIVPIRPLDVKNRNRSCSMKE